LPLQLLHGFTFVVLSFALTYFIADTVRPELKASGQAFHILVVGVICRIIGQMLGGYLSDVFSIRRVFFFNGILAVITVIAFTVIFSVVPPRSAGAESSEIS
jgi:PPP family 3-phenylpropionic acid transporter